MAKKETGKSFLLRLDAQTMEKVEQWAAQEFRSVNGQIQWIIADALRRYKRDRHDKHSKDVGNMKNDD